MKPAPGHNAIHILIAEDEKIVAMDLARRLEALGYPIVGIAGKGEDAIRLAFDRVPDIVLMDVHLSGALDGVEAGKRIRDRGGPPVVFATAYSDLDTLARARTALPFGYLLKPFQDDAIEATIEIAVGRWKAERDILHREKVLRSTLSAIGEAVIVVDESLLVTFMNSAAEKITGWQLPEALTSPVWNVMDLYAADGSELQQDTLAGNAGNPLSCLLKKKQGTTVAVTFQKLTVDRQGSEEHETVFIITREPGNMLHPDHVERESTSSPQYESAFNRAPLPTLLFADDQGDIVGANAAFLRRFSFVKDQVIGKSVRDVGLEWNLEDHAGIAARLRAGKEMHGIACAVRRGDGALVRQHLSASMIDELSPALVIGVFQDMPHEERNTTPPEPPAISQDQLIREVFHAVKNDLQIVASLLSVQAESMRDEQAKNALLESHNRIQMMSRIQEKLRGSNIGPTVDATEYLQDIAQQVFAASNIAGRRIGIDVQIESVPLDRRRAVAIGLAIRELITNALKHAFPGGRAGTVSLSCRRKGNTLNIVVADDGNGDVATDEREEHFGMQFVRSLAKGLGGSIDITHIYGTEVKLTVPEESSR